MEEILNGIAPGPWIERNGHVTTLSCYEKHFSDKICTLEWGNLQQDKANGKVIAAIPDFARLALHIEAIRNDAHFSEHPEWESILEDLDLLKRNLTRDEINYK